MPALNDTECKINCGVAKKVGRPNYSSYEANLNIEITTNLASMTDDQFPHLIGEIYNKIQQAVDARIAWECRDADGPNLVPKVQIETMHPQAISPVAQVATPAQPSAGYAFRDYLAATSNELAISPQSLVNYFYRLFINSNIDDANWQQQGAALAQHWNTVPNAVATYAQSLNNMPAF